MATVSAGSWVSKYCERKKPKLSTENSPSHPHPPMILEKFWLEIKKLEVVLSISLHEGILNKHLCKNFLWWWKQTMTLFFADGDALVYLVEPMYKKYFTKFVWGHPFSTYVSYDQFFNSPLLYALVHILDDPSSIALDLNNAISHQWHYYSTL